MPAKTGYVKTFNPQSVSKTKFELKWGEPAYKIAQREDIIPASVHQRVHLYGTPYQRKAKPSTWEAKYGKTIVEICKELYIHPVALHLREKTHGNVYCEDTLQSSGTYRNRKLEKHKHTKHWSKLSHFKGDIFWLMPEHPDYQQERDRALEWDCGKHIALAQQKIAKQQAK